MQSVTVDLEVFVAWLVVMSMIVLGTWGRGIILLWLAGCLSDGSCFGGRWQAVWMCFE